MVSIDANSQTLKIIVDFQNQRLIGETSISVCLGVSAEHISVLEKPPDNDVEENSGAAIPLHCPNEEICEIVSVDVDGMPALFFHSSTLSEKEKTLQKLKSEFYDLLSYDYFFYEVKKKKSFSVNLFVDIPPLALHHAAMLASRTEKNSSNSFCENPQINGVSETYVLPLKVNVHFRLTNLNAANSIAYFTSYCFRPPRRNKLYHYDLFITRTDRYQNQVWFPSVPSTLATDDSESKKTSVGRLSWTLEYTVPLGMVAIGSGCLVRRVKRISNVLGEIPVETFFFETRGNLGLITSNSICLFCGHFQISSKKLPEIEDKSINISNTQFPETSKSPKAYIEPQVLCVTFKGIKKCFVTPLWETVAFALNALHKVYGVNYPYPQLILLFFPLGNLSIPIGEGIANTKFTCLNESIPNTVTSWCTLIYGVTVVLDINVLHHKSENHPSVFRAKEVIAEGILSVPFGSILSVPLENMAKDLWLLVAFRRLVMDSFIEQAFGIPHLESINWLKLELYARLVETGYEVTPLSNAYLEEEEMDSFYSNTNLGSQNAHMSSMSSFHVSSSWFNPNDFTFGLKTGFIFPSLLIFLTTSSQTNPPRASVNEYNPVFSRWSPPVGAFKSFLCSIVQKCLSEHSGRFITTSEFHEKLKRRLKAVFISSGAWKNVTSGERAVFPTAVCTQDDIKEIPTPDTLDLSLYENTPSYNIGSLLSAVDNFFDSWIYGVGCCSSAFGVFIQLQKKTSSIVIESCRLRYDETPMQPPSLIDSYTGISDFHPSLLACKALLEIFLDEACELENQQELNKNLACSSQETNAGLSFREFFASHDLSSLFHECHLELTPSPSPFELIVKDNGGGLGFGYTGQDLTPITNGFGSLFNSLQTKLNSEWSMIEPDRRVILTADTTARNALLSSRTDSRTLPLAILPQFPSWFVPVAASTLIRDVLKYSTILRNCSAVRSGLLKHCLFYDDTNISEQQKINHLPRICSPLSYGFGKFYTHALIIHTCGDGGIVQDCCYLCSDELPATFELRGFDDATISPSFSKPNLLGTFREKGQSSIGNYNSQLFYRTKSNTQKFCGVLSAANDFSFCSDSMLMNQITNSTVTSSNLSKKQPPYKEATVFNKVVRKDKPKHLPILWMRLMGNSRPIWLARYIRCQSIAMWEQQLLNDPLTTCQLEAAEALGKLPFSQTVLTCLARVLRNHTLHPLVRTFSAQALKRLHNENVDTHEGTYLSILLNYLYMYHYRSKPSQSNLSREKTISASKETEGNLLRDVLREGYCNNNELLTKNLPEPGMDCVDPKRHKLSNGPGVLELFPRNAPFSLTTEMVFLKDLLTAIVQFRSPDGKTSYEAVDTLTQLLMHHATDVSISEQDNADYCVAHIISTLKYVRFPFQAYSSAIEDVSCLARCSFLISLEGNQAESLDEARQALSKWKDEDVDSYTESLFLHIWRYYRLDHCLHSRNHVITCACIEVFSRNPMLLDLLRLKLTDEAKQEFNIFSFLPINFLPVIHQALNWLKCDSDLLNTSATYNNFNGSTAVLAREQIKLITTLKKHWHKNPLCKMMLTGLAETILAMRDNYCHYQDEHVERAALKALLYCTAIGSMEPPLILLTRNSPIALTNIQSVTDLIRILQTTCFTQYPSSTLHAQAMTYVAKEWSYLDSSTYKYVHPESSDSTLRNISSDELESVSRYLFCCRWTSKQESDGLQRSGLSLLNAVMLACRLDEIFTASESVNILVLVWNILGEVLEDLLHDAPLVFSAYCIKPCKGLDEESNNNQESAALFSQSIFPDLFNRNTFCSHVNNNESISHVTCNSIVYSDTPHSLSCPNNTLSKNFFSRIPEHCKTECHTLGSPIVEDGLEMNTGKHSTVSSLGVRSPISDNQDEISRFTCNIKCDHQQPFKNFHISQNVGQSPPEHVAEDENVEIPDIMDSLFSLSYNVNDMEQINDLNLSDTIFVEDSNFMFLNEPAKLESENFDMDNMFDDVEGEIVMNETKPITVSDKIDDDIKHSIEPTDQFQVPRATYLPQVFCVKVISEYMRSRVLFYPSIVNQRLTGVKKVYYFLFGIGLPQCLALVQDTFQTPDPFLIDTYGFHSMEKNKLKFCSFNASLKYGRSLRKLCLFQKRYLEDDSAEVPDWQTLAMEIIELLISLPLAAPFLEEVSPQEAPNYRSVVKEPMWLRLIRSKLQNQLYGTYQAWKNDLFLIFRNCRTFNSPDSRIIQNCESLQTVVYSLLKPTEKLLTRNASVSIKSL